MYKYRVLYYHPIHTHKTIIGVLFDLSHKKQYFAHKQSSWKRNQHKYHIWIGIVRNCMKEANEIGVIVIHMGEF